MLSMVVEGYETTVPGIMLKIFHVTFECSRARAGQLWLLVFFSSPSGLSSREILRRISEELQAPG